MEKDLAEEVVEEDFEVDHEVADRLVAQKVPERLVVDHMVVVVVTIIWENHSKYRKKKRCFSSCQKRTLFNFSRSGSSFKGNAMSFGAGVVGGMAAYSLMRSMSTSYRPGYYEPGYGCKDFHGYQ